MADVYGTHGKRSSRSQHIIYLQHVKRPSTGDKNQQVNPGMGQGGWTDHCQLLQGMKRHMQTLRRSQEV